MTEFSSEGINFKIIDESLKKCSVGSGEKEKQTALVDSTTKFVKIPSTVKNDETNDEYTVTLISEYTFWKSSIETVIIPFTVEEIRHAAFAFSNSLKNVLFEPGSRLAILGSRFIYETNVSRIVLPPNIKEMHIKTFEYANNLSEVFFCGNIKINVTFLLTNTNFKVYVPTNFKYSSFGGIPIVKTNKCSRIRYVTYCPQRKKNNVLSVMLIVILS